MNIEKIKEDLRELYYRDRATLMILKLFVKFLRENNCLDKFIINRQLYGDQMPRSSRAMYDWSAVLFHKYLSKRYISIITGDDRIAASGLINNAFEWVKDTSVNSLYWYKLSSKWVDYIKDYNPNNDSVLPF